MHWIHASVLCAALTVLGVPISHAAPSAVGRSEAVRLAREARKHYDSGEYIKAIRGYEGAFRVVHRASLLFNIADCYERLGKLDHAVRYYRRYLKLCAPAKRAQVHKLIAAIRHRPATLLVVTRPRGAKVWLNSTLQTRPTPTTVSVPPGRVHLRVALPGYRVYRQWVVARPGAPLNLVITLDKQIPVTPPPPNPGASPEPWERSGGFVGLAGGLKKAVYQGVDSQPQLNYGVVVTGGYALQMGARWRLDLGARLFVSTIDDGKVLTLLDVSGLVGVRATLHRRLFVSLRAGLGVATMLGVTYHSFFFRAGDYNAGDDVPATYASVHLWAGLGLGYRVWRRLSVVLTVAGVDYIPPVGHLKTDARDLKYIFRYNFHLGVMVTL